jgi:cobalt-zinc-cadmium efflux system protein
VAHHHDGHDHVHATDDVRRLGLALGLIGSLMAAEIVAGIVAHSLALIADAAHMLTDAGALLLALIVLQLVRRPARGNLTFGLRRAEILSAQANGATLLVLAGLIVYAAIVHLVSPPEVHGGVVLAVALAGIPVNLLAVRILSGNSDGERTLNVEGSYRHLLTDLYGFIATAVAAVVILATGFDRADAIASLFIAGLMLHSAYALLKASGRVFMEAAPAGLDPDEIGRALAGQPGVVEVHDLHVWEVTSGFPALSAHVVVRADDDCHELRRSLQRLLEDRFHLHHTTLQVDHEAGPLQIEVPAPAGEQHPRR